MLNVSKMILSARDCLWWPYASPGTNDERGIDCSGLFVKIFRDQGASIYHGSNTIYRKYCSTKGVISSASQLKVGCAVFKWNEKTPDKFNDKLGDFSHIGLVTSVNPLEIIHASSVSNKVIADTELGKWKYFGMLKNVDYGNDIPVADDGSSNGSLEISGSYARVYSDNGKVVHMRYKPGSSLYDDLEPGDTVELTGKKMIYDGNEWTQVNYTPRKGWWIMSSFLKPMNTPETVYGYSVLIKGLSESEAQRIAWQYPDAEIKLMI